MMEYIISIMTFFKIKYEDKTTYEIKTVLIRHFLDILIILNALNISLLHLKQPYYFLSEIEKFTKATRFKCLKAKNHCLT